MEERANGWRYWRLVENQAQKRELPLAQKMPKKRGAYQPSSARIVRRTHRTLTFLIDNEHQTHLMTAVSGAVRIGS